jgi:hypothetical protein
MGQMTNRFFLLFHAAVGIVMTVVLWLWSDAANAVGFAAGAGLSLVNNGLLVFTWARIFEKKLVALSIGVIVFKFAILGWIIYEVVTQRLLPVGWFAAGLSLVLLSTVATALRFAQQNPEKAEDQ